MGKKKLIIIICGAVLAVAAIATLVVLGVKGVFTSNEKKLNANLTTLGKQFYEDFYYPSQEKSQEDVKEFIKKFEKTGIKVNLENIAKVSKVDQELVKSMVNSKTKKECDKTASYVIIKPTKPYGKTDYTIEVNLDCGFEK
ncbi:MAG: hypothetical protein IKZ96_02970 [Bacilli bacterium]|nr:hypothetical protein [Bacilli bacterium]